MYTVEYGSESYILPFLGILISINNLAINILLSPYTAPLAQYTWLAARADGKSTGET